MTLPLATYLLVLLSMLGDPPVEKPSVQGAHVRRVCYDSLAIHLGDSFDSLGAFPLNPDANGPSMNPSWVEGNTTDFLWIGEDHLLDDGDILRPMASLTFSDRRTLRRVSIGWYLDGDRRPSRIERVVAEMKRLHPCLADAMRRVRRGHYHGRIDYGTYSEELTVAVKSDAHWQIVYEITQQP